MIEELQAGTGALNDIMERRWGARPTASSSSPRWAWTSGGSSNHSDAVLEMSTQIATSSEEQVRWQRITRNLDKVRHGPSRVEESASAAVAGTTGLKGTANELGQALTGLRI